LYLLTGLLLGLALMPAKAGAQQAGPALSADEAALRKLVAEQVEAWNRGDAKAWSKDFAADADFVNIFGGVFQGREQIEERHAKVFAGFLKGTRAEVTVRRLVFVVEGVAVLDTEHVVTGYKELPPPVQAVDGALRTRMRYVMKKGPEGWKIVAGQNTDVKAPPAPKAPPAGKPEAPAKP
jgi:uncharacterized protein (TIGR02246 family)